MGLNLLAINTALPVTGSPALPPPPSTPSSASKLAQTVLRNTKGTPVTALIAPGSPKASPVPPPAPPSPLSKLPKITAVSDVSKYDHEELLKFYRGELANVHAVDLKNMQDFPWKEKEKQHLYIQWMWPTLEESQAQPGAKGPVINDEFIVKLRADTAAVAQAKVSFNSMLEFYGLEFKDGTINKNEATFDTYSPNWCRPGDHNHARLSRMLESLQHFGLHKEAQALFDCLKKLWVENSSRFEDKTVQIWCEKTGHSWDEVQLEVSEIGEAKQIESTLDGLIVAKKKTHWILSDLSTDESSCFGRLIWAIIKCCSCLRNLFFGVNHAKARQRFMELTKKIISDENTRLDNPRIRNKWRAAAISFNSIVGMKHQIAFTRKFNNVTIVVRPGDIAKDPADVIVNAANERLLGGSGVDAAIHKVGGPEVLAACKEIRAERKANGRDEDSEAGEAVTTTPGKLPAKYLVHTVGPRWIDGTQGEEETLYKAYVNTLDQAAQRKQATINVPSLSTGVFSFPLDKAATKMVQAVKDFSGQDSSIRKVSMIVFWPQDFIEYGKALKA